MQRVVRTWVVGPVAMAGQAPPGFQVTAAQSQLQTARDELSRAQAAFSSGEQGASWATYQAAATLAMQAGADADQAANSVPGADPSSAAMAKAEALAAWTANGSAAKATDQPSARAAAVAAITHAQNAVNAAEAAISVVAPVPPAKSSPGADSGFPWGTGMIAAGALALGIGGLALMRGQLEEKLAALPIPGR